MRSIGFTRRAILAAATCLGLSGAAWGQHQFVMKMTTPGVDDVAVTWLKQLKAGIDARSGGRIKVEIYPANQLGPLPRVVEGVALGTIELALPAVGFVTGLEPRFMVLDAPGLFDDIAHAQRVLADPAIRKRIGEFGAAKGVEALSVYAYSPLTLLAHKPVRTPADLKGIKVRVPGAAALHIEPMKHFGAIPMSIPPGDVLPALQNRTIDGVIMSPFIFLPNKFYDVAKPQTYLPGSFLMGVALVNRKWMKSLGPELEQIVREEARKADELFSTVGVADTEKALTTWKQRGGENIMFSQADRDRYLKDVTAIADRVTNADPGIKDDYQALKAAAQRLRK